MDSVAAACVTPDGVQGDHARPGKRAVTLIQHEHLSVIGAMLGRDPVAPQVMRRNIVVAGVNLAALKGRRIVIGGAVLEITTICAPCSRMEEALGAGGYSAVRGHGGWCARVITPGEIALGAAVHPD
ncbi:MOSC domain-containing protein [Sulfitobacter sabulilitoris]|uniref:MOSC domain-containing protein n=2 Tax=Sulfitobacter sabulilitoris TaxID=2562655 RepID=A0A5S3PCA2_9RHOB|nr:MOSC domain-containing protein [Sulfitobacter sabulilitoris]